MSARPVWRRKISSRTPMRSSTVSWVRPLKSMAWPPGRSAAPRSTTVTWKP